MSANNYILIKELPDKHYSIDACDADSDTPYEHIATLRSLEDAIITAKKYEKLAYGDGYDIEYGLVIELIDGA